VVQPCQLSGTETIDAALGERLPQAVGAMGVQLGATLHHVGADPYGLAGLEVGCDVVECHARFV